MLWFEVLLPTTDSTLSPSESFINTTPNNKKSKTTSRKRSNRNQFRPPGMLQNERGNLSIHRFRKSVDKSALSSSTSADTLQSYAFKLTDLPEYASYTTIFDQYRIVKIELTFIGTNQAPNAAATLQRTPCIYTAIDYDDNGTPASVATVLNYANVRIHAPGKTFTIAWRPHAAVGMYNGTNFSNYGNLTSPWIDAASSDVLHFGVKVAIPSYAFISAFQVIAAYTVEFRNVR